MSSSHLLTVAVVGRANVGKSTLFNRLLKKRVAIVEDMPGVTRDRHYAVAHIQDIPVLLVDTGGFEIKTQDPLQSETRHQAEIAIREAQLIIFVGDGQVGLTQEDKQVVKQILQHKKPLIVAVNKVDHEQKTEHLYDFYSLGAHELVPVSAEHGYGIESLKSVMVQYLKKMTTAMQEEKENQEDNDLSPKTHTHMVAPTNNKIDCHVAVIGRPNVGKSSFINALLGEERLITSPYAGTTRDSIDTFVSYQEHMYCFIDTAGIRRKARINEKLEEYMVFSALKSIERAEVVVLVLDATEFHTDQDAKIAALCHERKKGIILVVNKWDLPHDMLNTKNFRDEILHYYPFLNCARMIYVSAQEKQGLLRVFDEINKVKQARETRISTGELNRLLAHIIEKNPPPMYKGKRGKLYYITQIDVAPPRFVLQVNDKDRFSSSYIRYIENSLREAYGFSGTPLDLILKERSGRRAFNEEPNSRNTD